MSPSLETETSQTARLLPHGLEDYRDTIKSFPLFQKIPDFLFFDLLNASHLLRAPRKAILVNQGETSVSCLIVVEGSLKYFRTNSEGKETIVDLATSGDVLLHALADKQLVATTSIETIEETVILSIPYQAIEAACEKTPQFRRNILRQEALRTEHMMDHLALLTLRDAKERLGFFLLKEWMKYKKHKRKELPLPFDKAVIASYLDIRPETFSRLLKTFQNDGYKTTGKKMRLPYPEALCCFCDTQMVQHCPYATSQCPSCKRV